METNTTFLPQKVLHQQLAIEIDHLDNLWSKINLLLQENLYPLKKSSYHFIAKMLLQLTSNKRFSKAFASSLFQSAYRAEVTSAGGGHLAFIFGITFAKYLLRENLSNTNVVDLQLELKAAIEYFKKHLSDFTKTSGVEDIQNIITASCGGDDNLATAVWEALKLAGIEGTIYIEDSRQSNYVVEYKEGHTFSLNPFGFMLPENKSWDAYNCKALIVDGLVEKISELDQILTKNLETKQDMVIFAHGFSEEVVATLKTNRDRGLLNIQPVRIPTDVDSLNVSNDLAVVCGTLPVSIMKGDMLVFVKYEDIPTVEHIRLKEKICMIENTKTSVAVASQITSLLGKRQSYYLHEEVQDLFDKRIRSLMSNSVAIYLPDGPVNKRDEQRMKIDLALRQVKTTLNNGIINSKELSTCPELKKSKTRIEKCFNKALVDILEKEESQNFSPASIFLGCTLAANTVLLLLSSSGFVEITYTP